jgi:hypothetical protein
LKGKALADLSVTASQVLAPTDGSGNFINGIAGATITAGQPCYYDSATSTYKLADANASQSTAQAVGIATHAALTGQPIRLMGGRGGYLTLGAGAAPASGVIYVVSATAGGIAPAADLATGHYTTILGVGASSNRLQVDIFVSNSVV